MGKLTNKRIDAAKPIFDAVTGKYKENRLADGDQLYLIVGARDKTWRKRYYFGGKERNISLGEYPEVGLAEARDKNRDAGKLLSQGIDPADAKKKDRVAQITLAEEKSRMRKGEVHPDSFQAVALDWLADVQKTWKPKTYRGEEKRVKKNLLGPLGPLLMKDITANAHVRPLFDKLHDEGKFDTLRKVAENTVRIFNFAVALGKCEHNPAYAIWKGLSYTKPSKVQKSYPTITEPDKIGRLLLDIDRHAAERDLKKRRSLEVCFASRIAPYVFLRPSSLVCRKWTQLDWNACLLRIQGKDMKNGKDFVVPLARQVMALFKELYAYTGGSEYIFPSWGQSGHITIEALLNVFSRTGYKGEMCGHGWRHAFVTNCKEALKYSSDVIYKQMSHTLEHNAAKAAYDMAEFLPERTAMMQDYADYLDGLRDRAAGIAPEEKKAA